MDWEVRNQLVYEHWRNTEFAEAREILEQSARDFPDLVDVTLSMAQQTLLELGPEDSRVSVLALLDRVGKQEGSSDPHNAVNQAVLRYEVGDRASTRLLLRVAVSAADKLPPPTLAQLTCLLGAIAYDEGDYDKAEEGYRASFNIDPGVPAYSSGLIHSLRKQGKDAEAQVILREALSVSTIPERDQLLEAVSEIT